MPSDVQKVMNWKAPEDDTALEFPPKDEPEAAAPKAEAKPRAKKPAAPAKPKASRKAANTGWFIETYPIVEKDGKVSVDMCSMVSFGPIQTTNLAGAMKSFKALAEKSPEAVNHHSIRIVKVEKVFSTKTRQVVEVVE